MSVVRDHNRLKLPKNGGMYNTLKTLENDNSTTTKKHKRFNSDVNDTQKPTPMSK